jgi:hypothetical protein
MILLKNSMNTIPVAALAAAVVLLGASSAIRQQYVVSGEDTYRIGSDLPVTHIAYSGTERLTSYVNDTRHFLAEATYTRDDEGGRSSVSARFAQQLTRDGNFEDQDDEDPDFLTILNQPFAIWLDATTMKDLRAMRGHVPFEATSPLGSARLHGYLRSAPAGKIAGVPVVGVQFQATGPMIGTLPQHSDARLEGTIRMDGSAYYATAGALLLALDATLTIDGSLSSNGTAVPVRIVYHRAIRAVNGSED